jgi:hypothetical protein
VFLSKNRGGGTGVAGAPCPGLVKVAVSIIDFFLILAFGMGIIGAVNFAALMTARQNYRLKRLMLFPDEPGKRSSFWSGTYGFRMKISGGGVVLLSFGGGLAATCQISREEIASRVIIASLRSKLADLVQLARSEGNRSHLHSRSLVPLSHHRRDIGPR